jgi:uncharacterized protein (DUF3820 family)
MASTFPFGKYKGQPIEDVLADESYCAWLDMQSWFREKFGSVNALRGKLMPETKTSSVDKESSLEHNKLQALFLDNRFSLKVARNIDPTATSATASFEDKGIDVLLSYRYPEWGDACPWHALDTHCDKGCSRNYEFIDDVTDFCHYGNIKYSLERKVGIELKPTVGDDAPNVLRQMKSLTQYGPYEGYRSRHRSIIRKCSVLLLGKYTGKGFTKKQFVDLFERSEIAVLFLKEL